MAPAMSLFQPCRILLFFYDNLTNGDKASIWLRERHVRQADGSTLLVREVNWRGDGPWHGWWRFNGFADGPFHELTIAFNCLFPHRPQLHPVYLLRQNGTQWTGADYASRRVEASHDDTFELQTEGFWKSERQTLALGFPVMVNDPMPQDGAYTRAAVQRRDAAWPYGHNGPYTLEGGSSSDENFWEDLLHSRSASTSCPSTSCPSTSADAASEEFVHVLPGQGGQEEFRPAAMSAHAGSLELLE